MYRPYLDPHKTTQPILPFYITQLRGNSQMWTWTAFLYLFSTTLSYLKLCLTSFWLYSSRSQHSLCDPFGFQSSDSTCFQLDTVIDLLSVCIKLILFILKKSRSSRILCCCMIQQYTDMAQCLPALWFNI